MRLLAIIMLCLEEVSASRGIRFENTNSRESNEEQANKKRLNNNICEITMKRVHTLYNR